MSQDDSLAAHDRLLRGENGVPGLMGRVAALEECTEKIERTLDTWMTATKTVGIIVAVIGLANVVALITLMARAVGQL